MGSPGLSGATPRHTAARLPESERHQILQGIHFLWFTLYFAIELRLHYGTGEGGRKVEEENKRTAFDIEEQAKKL